VTTGALYHHFATKTALFEAVFEALHEKSLAASAEAASHGIDDLDRLARGSDAFLDSVLDPEVQRILIGALTRGAMLIANSQSPKQTRDAVSVAMRRMLTGLSTST
jgi:AcrR family transcriptional regulator